MTTLKYAGLAAAALVALAGCTPATTPGAPATQAAPPASSAPAAPPASAPPASAPPAAPTAPATSAAAPQGPPAPGSAVEAGAFIDQVAAASKNMKTYTTTMTMKVTTKGKTTTMKVSGKMDVADPAKMKADLQLDMGGIKVRTIQIGSTTYMNMGGKWTKQASAATTPQSASEVFTKTKKAFQKVTYLGPETVNKTPMQHYRLEVDGKTLASTLGVKGDLGTVKYELWLDSQSFTRQLLMSYGGTTPTSMTMNLDNINKPVSIKAPI